MAQFRKKPVVIEAEQWFPDTPVEGVVPWFTTLVMPPPGKGGTVSTEGDYGVIITLEGTMKVSPGDWVITGVKGEKYPCKPDIFEATYEPV